MNKVLFVLHQKTSVPGDVGNKFRDRGYVAEICRPPLGEELPLNIKQYSNSQLPTVMKKVLEIMI